MGVGRGCGELNLLEDVQQRSGNLSATPSWRHGSCTTMTPQGSLFYRHRESSAFILATLAVSLMLAALAITLLVNVPLDYRFAEWTIATLPPDWRVSRDRWEFYHGVRTLLSVAGLSSLVGSVLVSRHTSGTAHFVKRAA